MNWQNWLKGFAAAVVGGAVTAAAQQTAARLTTKDAPAVTGQSVGLTAAAGALLTALAYFAHSPLTQPDQPAQPQGK